MVIRHIFDWADDCPEDVGLRTFPPIAGGGRGYVLEPFVCVRCGLERPDEFPSWHRPLNSGVRTCGGKVVPRSKVAETRRELRWAFMRAARRMAAGEAGVDGISPPPEGSGGLGLWQFVP